MKPAPSWLLVVGVAWLASQGCVRLNLKDGFPCSKAGACPSPFVCEKPQMVCVHAGHDGGAAGAGGAGGAAGAQPGGVDGGAGAEASDGPAVDVPEADGGASGAEGGAADADGDAPETACGQDKHSCAGTCVDDNSIDHCGASCDACMPPPGATATCDGKSCGFACGSGTKTCKTGCIPMASCCEDVDCPPQNGKTGKCDTGAHTCSYNCGAGTTPCGGLCIPTGGCCAETDCAGVCRSCVNNACVAVTNKDDADSCLGTCDAAGACKSKRGQTCQTVAAGCVAGSPCAPDGVCCDTACTETCKACNLATSLGTCTLLPAGSAPHGSRACAGTGACAGTCQGLATGACTFPTGACGTKACSSATALQTQGTCAAGSCTLPPPMTCASSFACAAGACKTTCAADADCAATSFCDVDAKCHPRAVQISRGSSHTCAVLADGTVRCWGDNGDGQLGNNAQGTPSSKPVVVQGLGAAKAVAVGAGRFNTCLVISDGTVRCFGENAYGQDGDITADPSRDASTTVPMVTGATAVTVGDHHACAIVAGGAVKCWGNDYDGQIGDAMTAMVQPPSSALAANGSPITGVVALSAGYAVTCGVLGTGGVLCWGVRLAGSGDALKPDSIATLTTATGISLGEDGHACVLIANGAVRCWGSNSVGGLGDGNAPTPSATPVALFGGTSGFASIGAGEGGASCAILGADGTARCWGSGALLGHSPPYADQGTPVMVTGLTGAKSVCVGSLQACALMANGSVRCWGHNGDSALGVGDTNGRDAPTAVSPW